MRGRLSLLAGAVAVATAACGTEPTGPDPAQVSIQSPDVVTLIRGETARLAIRVLDAAGNRIDAPVTAAWSSSAPQRVEVDDTGEITALAEWGSGRISVDVGGVRDSVDIWIQPPEGTPSTFAMTLVLDDDVPEWWRGALERARTRWEEVIRRPLPPVEVAAMRKHCGSAYPPAVTAGVEDGVRVYVRVSRDFPEGTYVEAVGGPCIHRGLPWPTTVVGEVTLNADHFDGGVEPDRLAYVAHHEVGHALGLVGVVQGFQPPWLDPEPGRYLGVFGLFGHLQDTGHRVTELSFADGNHWSVSDLMGRVPADRIGRVSIGALIDLGYPAVWYAAGPY